MCRRHALLQRDVCSLTLQRVELQRPAIRELRLEDIPSAASLLSDAFAPPDGYNPLQRRIIVAETEAGLAARLGKSLVFVAERDDGEIIGSVEAFTPAFLEGKAVRFWNASLPCDTYLSALAVAPGCRRIFVDLWNHFKMFILCRWIRYIAVI